MTTSACESLPLPPRPLPGLRFGPRALAARLTARLVARRAARREERDRRLRISRLLDYDDRLLDDMGLRRACIREALALPLGENAIEHLHRTRAR